MDKFLGLLLVVFFASSAFALPLWKVFCTTDPLFRGRADPIVNPGTLSQHSHKVWGGSAFGLGKTPVDPVKYYNMLRASSCTTCSIELDLSNYWIPDLYYQWPNGSLSLVPNGGLTVYYPSRGGFGNQTKPNIQPFPPGIRYLSGSPWRRSYNASKIADRAISYACLGANPRIDEMPYFPTNGSVCKDGLRAQVWFPMCWDGKNLDSPDHISHMSFPIQAPDHGDCPSTHPVRLPGVFFEILFDVNPTRFPHGNGHNPFVWSCGDSTGYGLHGDFLNGWDENLVRDALADPKCDLALNDDLAFGNNVKACPPMAPYVKSDNPNGKCQLAEKVNLLEDLGFGHLSSSLPGCNPITGFRDTPVTPCFTPQPAQPPVDSARRVLLKSVVTGKYLTTPDSKTPLFANHSTEVGTLSSSEVFILNTNWFTAAGGSVIMSEKTEHYLTAPNSGKVLMTADRNGASDWEIFFPEFTTDNTIVSFKCNSNNKYISAFQDGTVYPNATSVGPNQQFYIVDAHTLTQSAPPQQTVPDVAPPGMIYTTAAAAATATGFSNVNGASSLATLSLGLVAVALAAML
jgi:hypothetical protein